MIQEYVKKDFSKLLKAGALEGRRWMKATDSSAVRIYDRNLEDLPVTVELYDKWAKIVDYADGGLSEVDREIAIDLVNRMAYVERSRIVYQLRKKREGLEQHDLMSEEKVQLTVREHGLSFAVDLSSHIDTGLFLDLARVREYVRSISEGARVLNLFSYTGSFSVYAAAGGAQNVTSVDMSNTYCAAARENLAANGFADEERYPVVVSDALPFIKSSLEKGEKWDIIIFDPPSFSNSHKMEKPFDVKKDYLEWMSMLSRLMEESSILIFSCNSSTFSLDKGLLKKAFRIKEISQELAPLGFSASRGGASRVWSLEKMSDFSSPKNPGKYRGEKKVKRVVDQDFDALANSVDSNGAEDLDERSERGERRGERRNFEDRERSSYRDERSPRRSDDRRPRDGGGYNGSRQHERRESWGNRENNSFGDRRSSGYRRDEDSRDERPYKSYDRSDNRRGYGRRESYGNRENNSFGDRRSNYHADGGRPAYREGGSYEKREGRRNYNSDGQSYGNRENNSFGGRRSSYREDDRRPNYRDGGGYTSQRNSRYADDGDSKPTYRDGGGYTSTSRARSHAYDKAKRAAKRGEVKPYGYDSFKKSRNRDGSNDEE